MKTTLENKVLRESVESWEATFERFGLEPETAIRQVNDIERDYERLLEISKGLKSAVECLHFGRIGCECESCAAVQKYEDHISANADLSDRDEEIDRAAKRTVRTSSASTTLPC
jgi:hypothetical protein